MKQKKTTLRKTGSAFSKEGRVVRTPQETNWNKSKDNGLRVGGLFSGVGGIELGFKRAGFKLIWSNDCDAAASKTFNKNFDHRHIESDVRFLFRDDNSNTPIHLPAVDVMVGGFPCQAFSIAGYRKGFEDDRGNLFFQITRLIQEQEGRHGFKPTALLLENVKNFYTHDQGNTFDRVLSELNGLGYFVFHGVLNTSVFTKIPQNRERMFLVCFLEKPGERSLHLEGLPTLVDSNNNPIVRPISQKFADLLPLTPEKQTKLIEDLLDKDVPEKYYYTTKNCKKSIYDELVANVVQEGTVYQWRRRYVRENKSNVCPTLTANMGMGGHNVPLIKDAFGIRKLTPRECFTLQGFPRRFKFPRELPDSQLYKQAGNSVTVKLVERLARLMKKAMKEAS